MKRILTIALLFGAAHLASAGTTNIYVENWGSPNTSVQGASTLNLVGWTTVAGPTTGTGPYVGIFGDSSATDQGSGNSLPLNVVYFTSLVTPGQVGPGMLYTTDTSGNGGSGNSSFTDIDPTHYTNLTLNVEVIGSTAFTNYFAVLVGGQWYVSVTPLIGGGTGQAFTNASLPYTNIASAWDTLTINAANVTIGNQAGGNLNGSIQGIGIVELPTTVFNGWNYNELFVSAFAPNSAPPVPATITAVPISQTVYAGGGANFAMTAAGTAPITYSWQTNGIALADGTKYTGTATNFLTISNCTAGDGSATYSVSVTNIAPPGQTNSSFSLTVLPLPAGYLYAERYPYTGPSGNLGLGTVGWASVSIPSSGIGIFQNGTGLGAVFDYAPGIGTNLNYTTDTNDTGFSGLPFVDLNPDSYPAVTLQAQFSPGNGAGTVSGAITAYWAVQMGGTSWYSSVQPIPINISALNNYLLDQYAFSRVGTNWNNLTVGATVIIGSQASSPLAGNITGAGIIFVHNTTAGASMNWENFAITQNAVTVLAPTIDPSLGLENQSVAGGGGASFAVATSGGTQPFTYYWSLNGVTLTNGGRISGANSPTLTIASCTTNDSDPLYNNPDLDNGNVVAYVSNYVGIDSSTNYFPLSLQVTNPPIGQLYTEKFSYVGPMSVMPISSAGWTEAVVGTPNSLYQALALTGEGAVFASNASPATTVYYATSSTDTNQSGLLFPSINLAFYPSLTLSVDIAPAHTPANVTTYLAVQLASGGGSNWYVATNPLPVPGVASGTFSTYATVFNPAASKWKNLTVTPSGGIIGSAAGANLTGSIIGSGLVFVTTGGGGSLNIDNFTITGTGLGGINVAVPTNNAAILSWVGNPAVNLQSTTSLSPSGPSVWVDVPNTLGLYATNVSLNVPKKYFRLVAH